MYSKRATERRGSNLRGEVEAPKGHLPPLPEHHVLEAADDVELEAGIDVMEVIDYDHRLHPKQPILHGLPGMNKFGCSRCFAAARLGRRLTTGLNNLGVAAKTRACFRPFDR